VGTPMNLCFLGDIGLSFFLAQRSVSLARGLMRVHVQTVVSGLVLFRV
jgi:hypothetical protein